MTAVVSVAPCKDQTASYRKTDQRDAGHHPTVDVEGKGYTRPPANAGRG